MVPIFPPVPPLLPPPLPLPTGSEISILYKLYRLVKALFTKPKREETAQDVAERAAQQKEFCDAIRRETEDLEKTMVQHVDNLVLVLEQSCNSDEYPILKRYPIHINVLALQAKQFATQIRGSIAEEVAIHVTDSDPEFRRINWMLPGSEKEEEMHRFIDNVINQGTERCVEEFEHVIDAIQEEFTEMQKSAMEDSRRNMEAKEASLSALLTAAENHNAEQLKDQVIHANHVMSCCRLIYNELECENDGIF